MFGLRELASRFSAIGSPQHMQIRGLILLLPSVTATPWADFRLWGAHPRCWRGRGKERFTPRRAATDPPKGEESHTLKLKAPLESSGSAAGALWPGAILPLLNLADACRLGAGWTAPVPSATFSIAPAAASLSAPQG